jgi:hypothetical protein
MWFQPHLPHLSVQDPHLAPLWWRHASSTVAPPLQYAFQEMTGSCSLGDRRRPSLVTAPPPITLQDCWWRRTLLLVLGENLWILGFLDREFSIIVSNFILYNISQVPCLENVTASTSHKHMDPLERALWSSWSQASVQKWAILTEDSQNPPPPPQVVESIGWFALKNQPYHSDHPIK